MFSCNKFTIFLKKLTKNQKCLNNFSFRQTWKVHNVCEGRPNIDTTVVRIKHLQKQKNEID